MGFIGAMISVYINSFVPGSRHSVELSEALRSVRERLGGRWKQLLEHLPEVLDAFVGHAAVARNMLEMDDPWNGLKAIGIRSPHATGLMDFAHIEYINALTPELNEREGMNRLFTWLKPEQQEAKLSGASEAISAFLGHWTQLSPPEDDQRYLLENLIGLYGDPRGQRSGAWMGVPEPLMNVALGWLTRENIRFFCDIVSAVEKSHMWEPRRKFWLNLHRQGRIEGACVAFSHRAELEALRRSKASGSRGTLKYGQQIATRYGRGDTSLLILKIGRKIVVEGSHNYKVHIFDASHPKSPTLYKDRYDAERIRLLLHAKAQTHHNRWEGWVLENI
jgi:hypothetical protein